MPGPLLTFERPTLASLAALAASAALAFGSLTAAPPASATAPTAQKTYRSDTVRVAIDVPDDWETFIDKGAVMARKDHVGLMLSRAQGKTVPEALKRFRESMTRVAGPKDTLSKPTATTFAGRPATMTGFKGFGADGRMKLKGTVYLFKVDKDRVGLLMISGKPAPLKRLQATVKAIVKSARFVAAAKKKVPKTPAPTPKQPKTKTKTKPATP